MWSQLDNIIADVLSLELHLNKHILFINSIPSYYLIGEIVNVRADNSILGEDGNLDLTKLQPIIYDTIHNQ